MNASVRSKGLLPLFLILSMVLSLLSYGAAGAQSQGSKLSKHDRELLAAAKVQGQSSVTLLIASQPGANGAVASGIEGLGGVIRYRDEDVSYLRARVPADKVEAVAKLPGIAAVNLDEVMPLDDPAPAAEGDTVTVDPPSASTPSQNAYMPTRDIGAPQFVAANPTFDGRGVLIGIVDTGIDLLVPELQTAKTLAGQPVRKIVDWVTLTDPIDGDDPTWVNMQDQVSGASFTYKTVTYTAPAAGGYRIGLFDERDVRFGAELGNDLNRDGNPEGSSGLFAVLWDTATNTVWVDTDQDNSFADQAGMTDFKVNYDMGVFGTDRAATPERDTIPFVVQTDGKNKYVNIGVVSGSHGTHVAGIAAGKDFFAGAFDGSAPEAQVASVRACLFVTGCANSATTEGMIYLIKHAGVDVVNMSIGGLPALNDGNTTRSVIYNRLIEQGKAQMFLSAGNSGAGINTVGDPSVTSKALAVGAYVHKDTWLANYAAVASKTDGMFVFSSRGPAENGGFKPNIVASGAAVSSTPAWQAGGPVAGTYALPPGYSMFNGTSMAAPQAAGGAALLISAAKQRNVQWKPAQLRQAIQSSARYLPAYKVHEQGAGLFQVGAAWNLLKTNIKTVEIQSVAPVKTIISQYLATPNQGVGLYEREGWSAGQTGQRTLRFARTSGGSKALTYKLTWVGNDGTFSSAASISLPLNKWVALPVSINAATAGVHSAILALDDPATAGVDYQMLNTIVAAEQFSLDGNFSVTRTGQAARPDYTTFFFNVPANTPAFQVNLSGINGRVRLLRFHPYGTQFDSSSTTGYQTGGSLSRTVEKPDAGVWEAVVDTSRTSLVDPGTFTISAAVLGVDISPASWVVDPAAVGTTYSQGFTFTNRFGGFSGKAVGTTLGSAKSARPTISTGQQQVYAVDVISGSTSLEVKIGNVSDAAADLDLFLFDSAGVLLKQSADGDSEEAVTLANPGKGTYYVLVDGYAVPAGTTAYDYLDVYVNPAFGAITTDDVETAHPYNSSWGATASVKALTTPAAGRFLRGFVQVRSGSAVVGSAPVELRGFAQ